MDAHVVYLIETENNIDTLYAYNRYKQLDYQQLL